MMREHCQGARFDRRHPRRICVQAGHGLLQGAYEALDFGAGMVRVRQLRLTETRVEIPCFCIVTP